MIDFKVNGTDYFGGKKKRWRKGGREAKEKESSRRTGPNRF